MGKGDKKSKKGKVWRGSFGVSRNRKAIKARLKRAVSAKPAVAVETSAQTPAKPRKTGRKKAAG